MTAKRDLPSVMLRSKLWQQTLFTWDTIHKYTGASDANGRFDIPYSIGNSIHARTSKPGYLLSDDDGQGTAQIGLLRQTAEDAKLESQGNVPISKNCRHEINSRQLVSKNGQIVSQDICGVLPTLDQPRPLLK